MLNMNEIKRKIRCYSAVGIGGFITIAAATMIGVILYLSSNDADYEDLLKVYGRIRIMKVGDFQLNYRNLNNNQNLSKQIKNTIYINMKNSFQHFSKPDYSFEVTRFADDQIAQLVNINDRGVMAHFIFNTTMNSTVEKTKGFLEKCFNLNSLVQVEMNDLEIQAKPFIEMRSFTNFESFLSEKNNLNLNMVKNPNMKSPQEQTDSNVSCSAISTPLHGFITPLSCTKKNSSNLSSTCQFHCDSNHTLVGQNILTCLASGEWSEVIPICKAKCKSLQRAPNVEISPESCFTDDSLSGTRCFYYCKPGHVLEGQGSQVCLDTGRWSGIPPMCKKTCSPLSIPEDGEIWPSTCSTDSLLSSGSICSFSCLEGFTLAGSPTLLCDRDGSWNFVPPFCRRGCPSLISPNNGEIFPPLCTKTSSMDGRNAVVMEGVVCLHTCKEGYKLEGSAQRLCGAGGTWAGTQVRCTPICTPIKLPHLVSASPTICTDTKNSNYITEGQKCLLNCPEGFYLPGVVKAIVCLSNRTWGPELTNRCLRGCLPINSPNNGVMAPEKCYTASGYISQGTLCHTHCSEGFSLRGLSSIECLPDGSWSGMSGQCLKRCPFLVPPPNSAISPFNCSTELMYESQVCSYVCESDYGLHGNKDRLCQSDGTWSGYSPTCEAEKQFMMRQTYLERDICLDVNAVTGYVVKRKISDCQISEQNQLWTILPSGLIENVGMRKCLRGEYMEVDSHVMLEDCDSEDMHQLWIWEDDNGVSVTLSFTNLQLGYGHASVGKIVLTHDNTVPWYAVSSDGIHSLYEMFSNTSCSRLHLPPYTDISPSACYLNQTVNEETVCNFICQGGRKLIGDVFRFCSSGKWNASYPYCVLACPSLIPPMNGSVTSSCLTELQDEGRVCEYQCSSAYKLIGESTCTCLSSGNWSSALPTCKLQCSPLSPVLNGIIYQNTCTEQGGFVNDVCQLQCNFPFLPKNVSSLTCLSNGNWSSGNFSCQRGCPNIYPPLGVNGTVTCPDTQVWQGDTCNYTCGVDLHTTIAVVDSNSSVIMLDSDVVVRECMEDGLLNGSLPMCVSICSAQLPPLNGVFEPSDCATISSKIEGTVCKVKCDVGYVPDIFTSTTCQPDGTWSLTNLTCIEQTQFYIVHQITRDNEITCLHPSVIDTEGDGHSSELSLTSCYNDTTSLWTWQDGHHIQHVHSGLCLSVQDSSAKRTAFLTSKQCSQVDPYQLWTCTGVGRYIIATLNNEFYIAQDNLHVQAYRNSVEQQQSEVGIWLGVNTVDLSQNKSICSFYTNRCAPFEIPHHSTVTPEVCSTNSLVRQGITCHVECDEGLVVYDTLLPSTDALCSSDNNWMYDFEYSKPVECVKPCHSLSFNSQLTSPNCEEGVYGVLNQLCQFECISPSLTMIGESYIVCGMNGGWSGQPPTCVNVCSHSTPSHPSTVFATPTNCAFDEDLAGQYIIEGDVCEYECLPPYYINGSLHRTCLSNQTFDTPMPTCVIPRALNGNYDETLCSTVPPHPQSVGKLIEEGQCVLPGNLTRLCAWYECTSGYNIATNNVVHCSAISYTWPTPPACKRLCPDISEECSNMVEGEICYVDCDSHFILSHGNGKIICNSDGSWSDELPYCVYKDEFQISAFLYNNEALGLFCLMHNGNIITDPAVKLVNCSEILLSNRDFLWSWEGTSSLRHSQSSYCLSASTAANHGSRVELSECNTMDQLQHWTCSENPLKPFEVRLKFGDLMLVAENSTFEAHLAHSAVMKYQGQGGDVMTPMTSWTLSVTSGVDNYSTLCSVKSTSHHCPPLAGVLPPGGRIIPSACVLQWSAEDSECSFGCDESYVYVNKSSPSTTCRKEGTWSDLEFDCLLTCPLPIAPEHGHISYCSDLSNTKGTRCNFTCEFGYELVGEHEITCLWNGRWSSKTPYCTKFCDALQLPAHAALTPYKCRQTGLKIQPGTTCFLQCNEGYLLSSSNTISTSLTCHENGTWSNSNLNCTRVCPALSNPPNGRIFPAACTSGDSRSRFVCEMQCDAGYILHGGRNRVCLGGGTWDNSFTDDFGPVCRKQCPSFSIPQNSELICDDQESAGHSDGATCTVRCHPGYGLSPKGDRTHKCVGNKWVGEKTTCNKEAGFVIFVLQRFGASQKFEVCLSVDKDDLVEKISYSDCMEGLEAKHRWAWYDSTKLKNSQTGRCLSISNLISGQILQTSLCEPVQNTTLHNQWSCGGSAWFLHIANSKLYPDYGFTSTKHVYMKSMDDTDLTKVNIRWYVRRYFADKYTKLKDFPPVTVCATRDNFGVCPQLTPPLHGSVYPSECSANERDIISGLKCKFECDIGYKLAGENVITCQNNGVWSETPPICSILCESLHPIPNGEVLPSSCTSGEDEEGVEAGGSCSVECDPGWRLEEEEKIIVCLWNGEWNARQPTCKRECQVLSEVENAYVSDSTCLSSTQVEGKICSFACHDGYAVPRLKTAGFCQTVNDTEDCEATEPDAMLFAKQGYNTEINLSCLSSGSWSEEVPECLLLCPPLVNPVNGLVTPPSCVELPQLPGATCRHQCLDTTILRGKFPTVTCTHGKWIPTKHASDEDFDINVYEDYTYKPPTCESYCEGFADKNLNGSILSPPSCHRRKNEIGRVCKLTCRSEFVLKGTERVECLEEGRWNGGLGTCIKKCPAIISPANGAVSPLACTTANMGEGAICTFACLDKYYLEGEVTTTCDSMGKWSSSPPICKRRCRPQMNFYNGVASPIASCFTEHITAGEKCDFRCFDDFVLEGNRTLECLPSGKWTSEQPTCNRICQRQLIERGSISCNIYGFETKIDSQTTTPPQLIGGTICHVTCEPKFSPDRNSEFVCKNDGFWSPSLPQCIETGVPMYILQNIGGESVCLLEDRNLVIQLSQDRCLAQSNYTRYAAWHWLGEYNIQNAHSGRCIGVRTNGDGEKLRMMPCDLFNNLQHWDCSLQNPYQLLLKGTYYSPTTYYKSVREIVIQRWDDVHSYYSTFDLNTFTLSSLCSRRPGSDCLPIDPQPGVKIYPLNCTVSPILSGHSCSFQCIDPDITPQGSMYTVCMGNGLWSSSPPICEEMCDPLEDEVTYGTVYEDVDCVFDPAPVGRRCQASCWKDFELNGRGVRECLSGGKWSKIDFQCLPTCPAIFSIMNGNIEPLPCRSATCAFTCEPGYVLQGLPGSELYCLTTGKWNNPLPRCARDTQFRIVAKHRFAHVEMCLTAPDDITGHVTKLPCTPSHVADGSQLFKWTSDNLKLLHVLSGRCLTYKMEEWGTVSLEMCLEFNLFQEFHCGLSPGVYTYSVRTKQADFFLDVGPHVQMSAAEYRKSPTLHDVVMETQYLPTSQWIARHYFGQGTVCSMRSNMHCPPFPHIQNAVVTQQACLQPQSVVKNLVCSVKCDDVFTVGSSVKSICLNDGTWTQPLPTCIGMYQCPAITITNSALTVDPYFCSRGTLVSEGVTCWFACSEQYRLIGSSTITCTAQGMWSDYIPTCQLQCEPLTYVPGITVTPMSCHGANNVPGTQCQINCGVGFKLIGSSVRVCMENGMWSGLEASCIMFCDAMIPPSSGNLFPERCKTSENFNGNICNVRCNDGFMLVGDNQLTCYEGVWSNIMPQCVPLSLCPAVRSYDAGVEEVNYKDIINAVVVGEGTSISVKCKEGYQLVGPQLRVCLINGQWQSGTPTCTKLCPPINLPAHGFANPLTCGWNYHEVGTICAFNCDTGWFLEGAGELVCQPGGEWSHVEPICVGGVENDVMLKPFLLRQRQKETGEIICVRVNKDISMIEISKECVYSFNKKVPLAYQWRWRDLDASLVESMELPGLCWSPDRFDSNFVLGLSPCDKQFTNQRFHCGDIGLRQYALHIGTQNLWLAHNADDKLTNHVYLVTSPRNYNLDWEGISVKNSVLDLTVNSTDFAACSRMCNEDIVANEGYITSPGYPFNYPRNIICTWTVTATGRVLRLWVVEVNILDGKESCDRDSLTVMEGTATSMDASHVLAVLCDCVNSPSVLGRNSVSSRLVGGSTEAVENAPWHAVLFSSLQSLNNNSPLCGAVVIRPRYLLTAAHCVFTVRDQNGVDSLAVGIGHSELWRITKTIETLFRINANKVYKNSGAAAYRISRIFVNELYAGEIADDIAVLQTAAPITWSKSVFPICLNSPLHYQASLDSRVQIPKTYCKLAGWGSEHGAGEAVEVLTAIDLPTMSDRQCSRISSEVFGRRINSTAILCAGHFDGTRQSPCKGDSGGALACEWNGNYYVVGITGQQLGRCTSLNVPRYFARVSAYMPWIDKVMRRADAGMDSLFAGEGRA